MSPFLTIGIGASAGGIGALKDFFEHTPPDTGMAFIVILHLSPNHDSQLAQVLQQATKMPVTQVTEKTHIKHNHVYVIPPDKHLTMNDGFIIVSPNTLIEERRAPVDIFFRSLAESHKAHAAGIILSGTGANGSMGLKRIKECGGTVFVQNPREAEFNEMPRAAIATDLTDAVLNVAEIPERLIAYRNSLTTVHIAEDATGLDEQAQQALREVLTQLRLRTGHDFANYKRPTLLRRIERRINVHNLADLPAYAAYVTQHPDETQALLKDLLISVTNFFRDKKAFEEVETKLLPQILEGKSAQDQVRIWVAGCATGEEAYSIAMMCADLTMGMVDVPRVQIFATDIDEAAISVAREGFYTLNDAADVPPERLARYFSKEGDGYRIRRELRETVLFATHNFLKDPPFSRLDLVTCRNVLIYLNHAAQERVMETFHFALKPGSFLFLGTSESVDAAGDLFAVYNREQHIWQSRAVVSKSFVVPESVPRVERAIPPQKLAQPSGITERISIGELHHQLLELYAPPSLVVNKEYDILHITEGIDRYLRYVPGELSQNLIKVVHEELRGELRSALYGATQRGVAVSALGAKARIADTTETLNIHVRPMPGGDYMLVLFEQAANGAEVEQPVVITANEPASKHLEDENARLKMQLRISNEQHEFASEELKAGNEELQAMNEELRSATEELETSKEELQSINEELSTVNQELKVKVEEGAIIGANLRNIIHSTNIGTVILDRSFRVMMFTPAMRAIYNLIPADQSRPLADITNRLREDNLVAEAEKVLQTLVGTEREVETTDGLSYLVRVQPYRTEEDRIQGVVITFLDITERRKADIAISNSEAKYRTLFNSIDEGYSLIELIFDCEGHVIDYWLREVNPMYEQLTGLHNSVGKRGRDVIPDIEEAWLRKFEAVYRSGEALRFEYPIEQLGKIYTAHLSRVGDEGSPLIATVFNDVTERKRTEANLAFLAEVSQDLVKLTTVSETMSALGEKIGRHFKASLCAFSVIDEAAGTMTTAHAWSRMGIPDTMGVHRIADFHTEAFRQASRAGETYIVRDATTDARMNAANIAALQVGAFVSVPLVRQGEWRFSLSVADTAPRDWREDEIELLREITARIWTRLEHARAEEALIESDTRLRLAASVSGFGIHDFDVPANSIYWSGELRAMLGIPEDAPLSFESVLALIHPGDRTRVEEAMREAMNPAGSGEYEQEFRIIRLDTGEVRWLYNRSRTLFGGEGADRKPLRNTGVVINITGRKLAEDALRVSEERYRAALQSAEMAAWDWDVKSGTVIWNDQHFFLLGLQPVSRALDDAYFISFVHPEDVAAVEAALRKAVAETGVYKTTFRIIRADDNMVRWMSGFGRAFLFDETGHATRMVGVMYDITVQKELEQQKEQFISVASHELKTPVASVKSYAGVLKDMFEANGDKQSAGLMAKLDAQVDRLTGLINTLLDVTRIKDGGLEYAFENFDLNELVAEVTEDIRHIAKQRIEIVQEWSGEINADRERLAQVLTNLLSNAIKYSPGAEKIIVSTRLFSETEVAVSIQDFGIGMSEEVRLRVFERFYRAEEGGASTFPGLGLGLFIAAEIAQRHGGRIVVTSSQGGGSVFSLILPLTNHHS